MSKFSPKKGSERWPSKGGFSRCVVGGLSTARRPGPAPTTPRATLKSAAAETSSTRWRAENVGAGSSSSSSEALMRHLEEEASTTTAHHDHPWNVQRSSSSSCFSSSKKSAPLTGRSTDAPFPKTPHRERASTSTTTSKAAVSSRGGTPAVKRSLAASVFASPSPSPLSSAAKSGAQAAPRLAEVHSRHAACREQRAAAAGAIRRKRAALEHMLSLLLSVEEASNGREEEEEEEVLLLPETRALLSQVAALEAALPSQERLRQLEADSRLSDDEAPWEEASFQPPDLAQPSPPDDDDADSLCTPPEEEDSSPDENDEQQHFHHPTRRNRRLAEEFVVT